MKAENLKILRDNGFPVPPFTVVTGSEVDLSFSRAETFAVRSTFEGEDTGDSSFAGQFDTLLDVPRAEVASAVEQVRKSYEKETIRAYREALLRKSGEAPSVVPADHASRTAPVLVQEMLHPDMAGVAFSSNPTGLLNEIVLVVGEGLGDAVVEDRADTTTYYYNKDDALYYYETQGASPTLETGVLETLWDLVQRVEELYGRPMDIEYAVCGTDVYLLQARPITTFRGKDLIVLDSSNIVESYPDLTLPLSMSFAKEIYYEIFRALLIRATNGSTVVSELDPSLRDMVAMANGRVYYRITSWYDILRLMPFSDRFIAIWQEMLGVSNKAVDSDLKVPVRTKAVMLRTILNYLRITPREMDRLSEFYETYANDLDEELARLARAEGQEKVRGLLRKYHGLKNDVIPRWDITLMNDMYAFLFTALSGKKNREQLSNLSNLASMEPAKAMNALAETARAKGMDSDEYRTQKDRFLDPYVPDEPGTRRPLCRAAVGAGEHAVCRALTKRGPVPDAQPLRAARPRRHPEPGDLPAQPDPPLRVRADHLHGDRQRAVRHGPPRRPARRVLPLYPGTRDLRVLGPERGRGLPPPGRRTQETVRAVRGTAALYPSRL